MLKLAKIIQKIDKNIIIGVQPTDIHKLSHNTKLKIYSQHVDSFEPGRHTGYILPEAVKEAGAVGAFLNHSEHRLKFNELKKTIQRCKKVKLKTAVFAPNLAEAKKIEKLKPDYLIIEPPELVAGRISVSKAKPNLIKTISKNLKSKFLVGAGINSKQDVITAMKLGASGIGVSSAITKSKNPGKDLKELLDIH
ncbi:triosephosphate isomerase [archaeon BMS3Abin17]|nr:triosephosphate isomerase [archaeon BMS3Abin17]